MGDASTYILKTWVIDQASCKDCWMILVDIYRSDGWILIMAPGWI